MDTKTRLLEIERIPGKCSGHPVIAGTRHPVHDIVSDVQLYGGDIDRVIMDFPHFSRELIEAVMAWYAENREEIDQILTDRRAHHQDSMVTRSMRIGSVGLDASPPRFARTDTPAS